MRVLPGHGCSSSERRCWNIEATALVVPLLLLGIRSPTAQQPFLLFPSLAHSISTYTNPAQTNARL